MTEQFANKIETTLAADYTAASGTCTVTSAAGMPATGTFSIRLGNSAGTILRVTARAGAVLTVTVEQDDGNAPTGTTVWHGPTAAAMAQLKADAIAGVTGAVPGWPGVTAIVAADFAWLNQGGASETVASGIAYLVAPTGVGNNMRIRLKSTPATPFTVTMLIYSIGRRVDFNSVGMLLRETATGKIMIFHLLSSATVPAIYVSNSTGVTNITTNRLTWNIYQVPMVWLQINADGANVIFRSSIDGRNFMTLFSQAKNVDFTTAPDQIGYFLNNNNTGSDIAGSFLSWVET